jgi:hypothetical protein
MLKFTRFRLAARSRHSDARRFFRGEVMARCVLNATRADGLRSEISAASVQLLWASLRPPHFTPAASLIQQQRNRGRMPLVCSTEGLL